MHGISSPNFLPNCFPFCSLVSIVENTACWFLPFLATMPLQTAAGKSEDDSQLICYIHPSARLARGGAKGSASDGVPGERRRAGLRTPSLFPPPAQPLCCIGAIGASTARDAVDSGPPMYAGPLGPALSSTDPALSLGERCEEDGGAASWVTARSLGCPLATSFRSGGRFQRRRCPGIPGLCHPCAHGRQARGWVA